VRSIRDGERLVADNTQTYPSLAEVRDALTGLGIGAQLFFPLQRDGCGVVALSVQQQVPRAWTAEEVALAEEVAGRAWAGGRAGAR
jgi:GAF domain-containing protein